MEIRSISRLLVLFLHALNFQGKYAWPLEQIARDALGLKRREECEEHNVDSDQIRDSKFVETMQRLICLKYGVSRELSHFCAETDPYWGVSGFALSEDDAARMYALFKRYYC